MAMDMSVALKITAGVQGEQAVDRLNTKLRDVGQQGEKSAKQIRQAYMQLPAQLQDVVVSLAGGQNPFMVLLQQGSQVSTQFGGIGNAIRGIAAVITPARIALGAWLARWLLWVRRRFKATRKASTCSVRSH
jgi:phage-related minor tail protein